jgi:hypothetical protein
MLIEKLGSTDHLSRCILKNLLTQRGSQFFKFGLYGRFSEKLIRIRGSNIHVQGGGFD